jgi:hypothetical protein
MDCFQSSSLPSAEVRGLRVQDPADAANVLLASTAVLVQHHTTHAYLLFRAEEHSEELQGQRDKKITTCAPGWICGTPCSPDPRFFLFFFF